MIKVNPVFIMLIVSTIIMVNIGHVVGLGTCQTGPTLVPNTNTFSAVRCVGNTQCSSISYGDATVCGFYSQGLGLCVPAGSTTIPVFAVNATSQCALAGRLCTSSVDCARSNVDGAYQCSPTPTSQGRVICHV